MQYRFYHGHMADMIEMLFPHINLDNWQHFLTDIRDSEPEKFAIVWNDVCSIINKEIGL